MPKTNGCLVNAVREMLTCGCPECATVLALIRLAINFVEEGGPIIKKVVALIGKHTRDTLQENI